MSTKDEYFMRQITLFDVYLACENCKLMLEVYDNADLVTRWTCDVCRYTYVPFFDKLYVQRIPKPS